MTVCIRGRICLSTCPCLTRKGRVREDSACFQVSLQFAALQAPNRVEQRHECFQKLSEILLGGWRPSTTGRHLLSLLLQAGHGTRVSGPHLTTRLRAAQQRVRNQMEQVRKFASTSGHKGSHTSQTSL